MYEQVKSGDPKLQEGMISKWKGDLPIRLDQGRYFVVIGALCEGHFAIFGTSPSNLTPFRSDTFMRRTYRIMLKTKKRNRSPICHHCQKPLSDADLLYIVRSEVWTEAGMKGWDGGHLHLACIEERLGRQMKPESDLLVWVVGRMPDGSWKAGASRDYLTSPEFLNRTT